MFWLHNTRRNLRSSICPPRTTGIRAQTHHCRLEPKHTTAGTNYQFMIFLMREPEHLCRHRVLPSNQHLQV